MGLPEILGQTMGGPGTLRFVLQPAMALLLGFRDGRHDALLGRAPYLLALLTSRGERLERIKHGAKAVALPFLVAIAMDAVFQYVIIRAVSLRAALAVGILLIALPYMVSRALSNRLWRRVHRRAHQRA
jgi:hypothetical protein